MSTRVYMVDIYKEFEENGKKVTVSIQDLNPLFVVHECPELFETIRDYAFDCTNNDGVGEIELDADMWLDLVEGENIFHSLKDDEERFSNQELNILDKFNDWFKRNDVLFLNCY